MPEEYLTDDEQLEHVKRLAAEYGPWMIGAVVIGLAFVFGLRYYEQSSQRARAASGCAVRRHDIRASAQRPRQARQIADGLIKDYPNSPYADQAKLTLARLVRR